MWVRALGREDPLEKGMATHSSILAWKITWTEKPGGLQFMKSQRVRHDWSKWSKQASKPIDGANKLKYIKLLGASRIAGSCFTLWATREAPIGLESKVSACNAGDPGSIPELGRSSGEGNGNPVQYSCLENPIDGGAWEASVHGVAKSRTRLSNFTFLFSCNKLTCF